MRDLKLLKQMKDKYGITFSDNPCYYSDGGIKPKNKKNLTSTPVQDSDFIIYENIDPAIDVQLTSSSKPCKTMTYTSEMFRTTFSIRIDAIEEPPIKQLSEMKFPQQCLEHVHYEEPVLQDGDLLLEKSITDSQSETTELCEDNEEGNFKSSYAKQLVDSYQHRSIQSESIFLLQTTAEEPDACEEVAINKSSISDDKYEKLVRQLSTINSKLARNEEDLTDARKEILSLKLESARLKAENRSLRVADTVIKSPIKSKETDKMSIAISDWDNWSLQQKVLHLTNQLEKAEVTRHAYEAATIQLVTFLKTLTSTLTPLTNEERHSNSCNVSRTASMLVDIEKTLKNNKFDIAKEKSIVKLNNLKNSLHSATISDSKVGQRKIKPKRHKSTNSFSSNSSLGNSLRKDHIKIVKKRSKGILTKSESFRDIPSNLLPRLTRTLSADVIGKNNDQFQKSHIKDVLSASKNKGFFSSLRNVFKIEGEKSLESCNKKKKRKTFLSFSRRSKRNPSPVRTDPPSYQSSTFCVSYPASEEETGSLTVHPVDSLPVAREEADASVAFDEPDNDRPPSELMSGPREISVTLSMMDLSLTDITGPAGYVTKKDGNVEIARSNNQSAETC